MEEIDLGKLYLTSSSPYFSEEFMEFENDRFQEILSYLIILHIAVGEIDYPIGWIQYSHCFQFNC